MKIVKKVSNSAAVKKAIKDLDKQKLGVGWGKEQAYTDGTPVASIAVVQEYGRPSKNIPPRSFMRSTAHDKESKWRKQFAGGAKKVLNGKLKVQMLFDGIGLLVSGDIKKKISEITTPPLSPRTIAARLRGKKVGNMSTATKPLVDTGYMLNSLTYETENK